MKIIELIDVSAFTKQSSGLIFILFLIISGNYLGELFPCKIQKYLTQNVYLKHIIGFLTLLFFVVFADQGTDKKSFKDIILSSAKLYALFLLLVNTQKSFFIVVILLLGILYLIQLKKKDYEGEEEENNKVLRVLNVVEKTLFISFILILVSGFVIYLGEKKLEYGREFSYETFLLGKPKCMGASKKATFLEAFIAAFKKPPSRGILRDIKH